MIENRLFEALLDIIPFKAYAVDIETYEMVYANKLMRNNMYSPQAINCWEKVFGQENICSWCSIIDLGLRKKKFPDKEKYTCEFFDESDDKWLKSYDELISWPDGRDVKYSILVDITDQKEIQGNMIKSHANLAIKQKMLTKTNKNLQITRLNLEKRTGELLELTDVLEKKVEERTLSYKKAQEEAEQANRLKSEFLNNMSHELRTPMHQIINFAYIGNKRFESTDDKAAKYFEKITISSNRMMVLVENLLDLSSLETGKVKYQFEKNDIFSFIQDNVNTYSQQLKGKELSLEFSQPSFSTKITCDRMTINQVIQNLLTNSIKFSPKGGTIRISLESTGSFFKVLISDGGPGIPNNELESVFDKFIQSSKTKTNAGGTGLGLAICREILVAHNGKIWAENNPDCGATFCFMLPFK